MMPAYDRQLYNFVLNIKSGKKVYNRMIMEALTVKSYWPCCEIFMTKYFLHNGYTFNIKGRIGKGVLTIINGSYLQMFKIIYI